MALFYWSGSRFSEEDLLNLIDEKISDSCYDHYDESFDEQAYLEGDDFVDAEERY